MNLVKAVGFLCIIAGTLIYNQLIFKDFFRDKTDPLPLQESLVEADSVEEESRGT